MYYSTATKRQGRPLGDATIMRNVRTDACPNSSEDGGRESQGVLLLGRQVVLRTTHEREEYVEEYNLKTYEDE